MKVVRVNVIVEGHTEEVFINSIVGPALCDRGVYLTPRLMGGTGGGVSYRRLRGDALMFMKGDPTAHCTTFVDYYGLGAGFPGREEIGKFTSTEEKKRLLEEAIHKGVMSSLGDSYDGSRFLPYVQMHEFEGLLFSDTSVLAHAIERDDLVQALHTIRFQYATPEDIDEGKETAPSKRIKGLVEGYSKPFHGNIAAATIELEKIRSQCPLFNGWMLRLEELGGDAEVPGGGG